MCKTSFSGRGSEAGVWGSTHIEICFCCCISQPMQKIHAYKIVLRFTDKARAPVYLFDAPPP